MKTREIIYSSTIIVLGSLQLLPIIVLLGSTIIPLVALGIFLALALGFFWSSTIIGKWFFREWWRSTLRLEKLLLGANS